MSMTRVGWIFALTLVVFPSVLCRDNSAVANPTTLTHSQVKEANHDGQVYEPHGHGSDGSFDKNTIRNVLRQYGPEGTLPHFKRLLPNGLDCHHIAHSVGRVIDEVYDTEAFGFCGSDCHSGCSHGAIEAYFRDHGTT